MPLVYMSNVAKLDAQVSVKKLVWETLDGLSPDVLEQAGLSWLPFEAICKARAHEWRTGAEAKTFDAQPTPTASASTTTASQQPPQPPQEDQDRSIPSSSPSSSSSSTSKEGSESSSDAEGTNEVARMAQ